MRNSTGSPTSAPKSKTQAPAENPHPDAGTTGPLDPAARLLERLARHVAGRRLEDGDSHAVEDHGERAEVLVADDDGGTWATVTVRVLLAD